MKYKLTLETKDYNKCEFVFDDFEELTIFLGTALEKAVGENAKAIIKIINEGRCVNE